MISRDAQEKLARVFDGPTLTLLGTVDAAGRPWTRYVMGVLDDRGTIRIATKRDSRKVADVENLPFVHLLVGRDLFSSDCEYGRRRRRATGRRLESGGANLPRRFESVLRADRSASVPRRSLVGEGRAKREPDRFRRGRRGRRFRSVARPFLGRRRRVRARTGLSDVKQAK